MSSENVAVSKRYPFELSGNQYVLQRRVVDVAPIDRAVEGKVYAWGKTARVVCEDELKKAYQSTSGPFTVVDICSAMPIWPQIIRERRRDGCYDLAINITGDAVVCLQTRPSKSKSSLPFIDDLDINKRRLLRDRISPRYSPSRRLLSAAVQSVLYEPPTFSDEVPFDERENTLASLFMSKFRESKIALHRVRERVDLREGEKGRWDTIVAFEQLKTLQEELAEVVGGYDASGTMQDLANFFSRECVQIIRPYKVVSLDYAIPDEIIAEATRSFPYGFRDTDFYERSQRLAGKHVQADALTLPFARESVSFLSCIEGYPFYFKDLPIDTMRSIANPKGGANFERYGHIPFARRVVECLAKGGSGVFFPWIVNDSQKSDEQALCAVEEYWIKQGLRVSKKEYDGLALISQMSDREYMLTQHSAVFRAPTLTSLIVKKP